MKLVHIADTHLGLAAFSRLDPESGMNLREKQIYDNFFAAIDVIIREKPDVLVHAGDLSIRSSPRPGPIPPCSTRSRVAQAGIRS